MRYQDSAHGAMSAAELEYLEARVHDSEYGGGTEEQIDLAAWWSARDHCHKPRTYFRGYRLRRMLEMIGAPDLTGKRILDVGCGRGELGVVLALYGAEVAGVDLSRIGVESARRLAEVNGVSHRCQFDVQSASRLRFGDNSFDVVIFHTVLHHALKYPNVRQEAWRVLAPGGLCSFAEGIRGNPIYRAARSLKRRISPTVVRGDVDIDVGDLERFAEWFTDVRMEFMCLTLGCKELLARRYDNVPALRALFAALWYVDRALLWAIPALGPYCSEVVGTMRKRMPD